LDKDRNEIWKEYTNSFLHSSPAVADLDGDGDMEVVACDSNRVHVLDKNGNDVWSEHLEWLYTSPAIADINEDGYLDVVVVTSGLFDLYVLDGRDGDEIWREQLYLDPFSLCSPPAIGDINKDGDLEIVLCDGEVHVVENDGDEMWSESISEFFSETVQSHVAIADLQGNGGYPEIIVTICTELTLEDDVYVNEVYVLDKNGDVEWSKTLPGIPGAPAIADLNGDGDLEVVVGCADGTSGMVYAWDKNGSQMWSRSTSYPAGSPAIADLDGDGDLEIVVGAGSRVYAWDYSSTTDNRKPWPMFQGNPQSTSLYMLYSIEGYIKYDIGLGIDNADILIGGQDITTSNGSGYYKAENLPVGTYAIEAEKSYHSFTPSVQYVSITGDNESGINFTAPTHSISGYIKEEGPDGAGIEEATVSITGILGEIQVPTGSDGYYIVENLPNGNHTIAPSYLNYGFEPSPSHDGSVYIRGSDKTAINFYTYPIFGYVRRYGTGIGINGIEVKIRDGGPTGPIINTLTTHDCDNNPANPGYYKTGAISGTYTIEASNPTP